MVPLRLCLFGGLQLDAGRKLASKKAQALFAYLASTPGQAHPREALTSLLWPDVTPRQGRDSLRQVLLAIRKLVGDALVADGDTVALRRGAIETDAAELERLADQAPAEAVARVPEIYRGDFLAGLTVHAAPFDEWLTARREQYRDAALRALEKLLALQMTGHSPAAAATARRLLALDPTRQSGHRALMRLHAAAGQPEAALKQYLECAATLKRELGITPHAETRELYQAIVRAQDGTPPARPRGAAETVVVAAGDEPALIGRDDAYARLSAARDAAFAGRGSLVVVAGEAGIGKTRLVDALRADVRRAGALALTGRCYDAERILPLAPWADVVRHALAILGEPDARAHRELAGLVGEGAPPRGGAAGHAQRLFASVADLLAQVAAKQHVVVVLEDLHWSDEMTVSLVSWVARRIAALPVLVVVTIRSDALVDRPALARTLASLGTAAAVTRIDLAPLTREHTLELVRSLLPDGVADAASPHGEQVWQLSRGNPFMAIEGVRAVEQGVALAGVPDVVLPPKIRDLIAWRLGRCSEPSRQMAAVASVIGRAFDFALLASAAGIGEMAVAAGVEELARRNVLTASGGQLEFTHERLREVAYAQILPPVRKALHAAVAQAIETVYANDVDAHASALAVHYRESQAWDRAVATLRRAGVRAMERGGPREAAQCFERALDAIAHLPGGRESQSLAVDTRLQLCQALLARGAVREMLPRVREAEALAQALGDGRRIAEASGYQAVALAFEGRYAEAIALGARALALADELHLPIVWGHAIHALSASHYHRGDYREVVRLGRLAAASVPHVDFDATHIVLPVVSATRFLARSLAMLGETEEADAVAAGALAASQAAEHLFSLVVASSDVGYVRLLQGRYDEAAAAYARGAALAEEGAFTGFLLWSTAGRGLALARAGAPDEGVALLEHATRAMTAAGITINFPVSILACGEALLRAGRIDDARREIDRGLALARAAAERGVEAIGIKLAADVEVAEGRDAAETYRRARALASELGMRPLVAEIPVA